MGKGDRGGAAGVGERRGEGEEGRGTGAGVSSPSLILDLST